MNDHPVWHVYDELRTAKLNLYYYREVLGRARRWQTVRELLMAASGSTGVAGLWLFSTGPGDVLWKWLASVTAFIALYQSVARPSERIRCLETQTTGWAQLEHSLADMRRRIHELGRYDGALQAELKGILDGKLSIIADVSETHINTAIRDRCFEAVKKELPLHVFFVPEPRPEK